MPQSSKLSERDQILELTTRFNPSKNYRDSKQSSTIRFNRISRKILFMRLCDFEPGPGRYFESVPGRIKGSFSHLFSPRNTFYFYSPMSPNFLYYTVLYFVFEGGGGTIFICKIILPEVISATWCPLSLCRARRNYPFSGPWLRPYIIRLGL